MKKIILIAVLFTSVLSFSQTTDVITGLDSPRALLLDGDDLYYSENGGSGTISKIDINDPSPTPVLIAQGIGVCRGLAKNGNDLYFSQYNNSSISKIDVLDPILEIVTVKTGLNTPGGLALKGNELYFSDENDHTVKKMDITLNDPPLELVAAAPINFFPTGIHLTGNILYMTSPFTERVSKVDVTSGITQPEDVVTSSRATGVATNNNLIYMAEINANKITVKDLNNSVPVPVDFVTGVSSPRDVVTNGTTLFIAEYGANKISKVELTLGVNNFNEAQLTFFPNPTSGSFTIDLGKSYPEINTTITNVLGQVIASERFVNTDTLDLNIEARTGIYFVNVTTSARVPHEASAKGQGLSETIKIIKN